MGKEVILYPGSFNPVHCGHLAVAEGVLATTGADALWFVVSPHNPFKTGLELAPERHRLEMVRLAVAQSAMRERMEACDAEFALPKPTFTVDTLRKLSSEHPAVRFSLLIGGDNVNGFERWKESGYILDNYRVLVYPRAGYEPKNREAAARMVWLDDAVLWPHAATAIRSGIEKNDKTGMHFAGALPEPVWEYIKKEGLYGYKEV